MALHHLPAELLDAICLHLPAKDLANISRTSPVIYPAAQRLLYRHVSIHFASRNLGIIVTLANKPHLASFVRSFAIRLDPLAPLFSTFYHQLGTALSHMTGLTTLDIFVDTAASWILQATESSSTYPQLTHFASSFPLDSHVARFLEKADALQELEVDSLSSSDSLSMPSLSDTSLPRLYQFIGSSQAAQVIVPGRPVESIHLNSGDLTEDTIEDLAKSTAPILLLGANTSTLPVPLLTRLSCRLPDLVYLRILTSYTFSEAPDITFFKTVRDTLQPFRAMESFELSGMHWGCSKKSIKDEEWIWTLNNQLATEDMSQDVDLYSDVYFAY